MKPPDDAKHSQRCVLLSQRSLLFLPSLPRLPLHASSQLFDSLAKLGNELVALHLLESSTLDKIETSYTGPSDPEVETSTPKSPREIRSIAASSLRSGVASRREK